MSDVIALGEVLIDFRQEREDSDGYPTLTAQPGGAPANFLAALAKYGKKCSMIGKVGDDVFGHLLAKTLQDAGIDTYNLIIDDKFFTTLAFVTLGENGERSFSFARKNSADTNILAEEIDFSKMDDAKVFHFGTLSMTHYESLNATAKCIIYAKEHGKLVSFDPNLRLPLWENPANAKTAILTGMQYADIVKISDEEVDFLFECDEVEGAKKLIGEYGVQLVYVTMGAKGAYYSNGVVSGYVDSPAGIKAVDTTGAGDIFGGSAMSVFLDIGKQPKDLTQEDLEKIVKFAVTAASLSTLKHGGIKSVPEMAEVEELM